MRRNDRQVTDLNEINEIIKQCKTCHLAMVDNGEPYVVPLSYGYKLENETLSLYLHCAKEGRKLDILRKNNRICFEMCIEGKPVHTDTPCNSGYYYSSVMGYGNVEFVEDVREKCEGLSIMFKHQADKDVSFTTQQAENVTVFKIVTKDFTAKRKISY